MKFDVTAVFCEVISGLALALLTAGVLDLTGMLSLTDFVRFVAEAFDSAALVGVLIGAYVLGILLSSLGLLLDEFVFNLWAGKAPTDQERAHFFRSVTVHVLAWRDATWAYRFCYRNLGVVALAGAVIWPIMLIERDKHRAALVTFLLLAITAFLLFWASSVLYRLYNEITRSVGALTRDGCQLDPSSVSSAEVGAPGALPTATGDQSGNVTPGIEQQR